MDRARQVGILIFDGVEVLDFAGPFEVFSVAGHVDREGVFPRFEVVTIAESAAIVETTGKLRVESHHTITDHPPLDILVVPGGRGTRALQGHRPVLDWIARQSSTAELTTSVCTGSLLLGAAGLLAGRPATTHWGSIERMRETFPDVDVREHVRFVDAGDVVTSAGISAGIDMSLAVVARLHGQDVAWLTARHMEYDWRP